MGIRQPQPRPQDVAPKVAAGGGEQELADAGFDLKAFVDQVESAAKGAGQRVKEAAQQPPDELVKSFAAQVEAALPQFAREPEFEQGPPVVSPLEDLKGFARQATRRAVVKLGTNPEDQRRILARMLGPSFETKVVNGTQVGFKPKGSKGKYKTFDPTGFQGSFGEAIADIVADFTPEVMEGLASAAGISAGALVGGTGGTAAAPGAGTIAGAVGGAALGGALGAGARHAAARVAAGGPITADFESEAALGAGFNVAALGAGAVARKIGRGSLGFGAAALEQGPMQRVAEAADVRKRVVDTYAKHGPSPTDVRAGGEAVHSALENVQRGLGAHVGTMKKIARDNIDTDALWDADGFMAQAQEILSQPKFQNTIQFRPDADGITQVSAKLARVPREDRALVRELTDMFNEASKNAGRMKFDDFEAFMGRLESVAGNLKKPAENSAQGAARSLRGILRQDESKAVELALPEGDALEVYRDAFRTFSQNVDELRAFRQEFRRSVSREKFVEDLIKPKGADRVAKLKYLLHEDSPDFRFVKGEFLDRVFNDIKDPVTGAIDFARYGQVEKRFGREVMIEVLGPEDLRRVQAAMQKAKTIPLGDIKDPGTRQLTRDAGVAVMGTALLPQHKAAIIFRLLGFNARAAKYLTDEGLTELAAKGTGKTRRQAIETLRAMRDRIRFFNVRELPDGRQVLVPKSLPLATNVGSAQFAKAASTETRNLVYGAMGLGQPPEPTPRPQESPGP